jgi:hypothetical protein
MFKAETSKVVFRILIARMLDSYMITERLLVEVVLVLSGFIVVFHMPSVLRRSSICWKLYLKFIMKVFFTTYPMSTMM